MVRSVKTVNRMQYSVPFRETRNASGKAKTDCSRILLDIGYAQMYTPSSRRMVRVFQQAWHLLTLNRNNLLFVQYPANIDFFYRLISKRKIKSIAIAHDIEFLRGVCDAEKEFQTLNLFDGIIVHSEAMKQALRDGGYRGSLVVLGLFDYLVSSASPINRAYDKGTVCFAGNLEKSSFVAELHNVKDLTFNLYGLPEPHLNLGTNVRYRGSYSSEEIVYNLEAGWGLVWDGPAIDACVGGVAEYLRFNSPHKASMYIVAELPLIVWSQSAIASLVKESGIGICLDSLEELPEVLSDTTDDSYRTIIDNVKKVKKDLVKGNHLRTAVESLEREIATSFVG